MRAKILSSTSTFNGVSYNTAKTQNSKGELMKFRNFGYLQNSSNVSPDEMKTFLKAHSKRNCRVKDKQFHAMISCKGREYGKEELTKIAEDWLHKMGYGQNPYLIVYHSDTKNNHVHIVSSRIGMDGKKVKDNMERIKAQTYINEIMKMDPKMECSQVLQLLNNFNFSTKSQFKLFLETHGFNLHENGTKWDLYKYGVKQGDVSIKAVENQYQSYQPKMDRVNQLKALFIKYGNIYDTNPIPIYEPLKGNRKGKQIGYNSEWSEYLKEKFGVEIIYHGKAEKAPYGFTIIDHHQKQILKGSEVLSLKKISQKMSKEKVRRIMFFNSSDKDVYQKMNKTNDGLFQFTNSCNLKAYRLKLLAASEEYSTIGQGLTANKLKVLVFQDNLYLQDTSTNLFINLKAVLDTKDYTRFATHFEVSKLEEQVKPDLSEIEPQFNKTTSLPFLESMEKQLDKEEEFTSDLVKLQDSSFSLLISDDADDEAVLRRDRKKKGNSSKKHR